MASKIRSILQQLPRHGISQLFKKPFQVNFTARYLSSIGLPDIKSSDLRIQLSTNLKEKPKEEELVFGENMSDHMLLVEWSSANGWDAPHIVPFGPLHMSPACSVFHYACEIYEGLKCYRDDKDAVRLFRPMENMKRFQRSAARMCLPATLGIKPPSKALLFVITCPVGPYFKSGTFNPVSLLADPKYVRAWPGGVGEFKAGGNYGATVHIQRVAEQRGCNQVLWLFEDKVTEVGTMNIFMHWINDAGGRTNNTSINGLILPGITRDSLLALSRGWNEFKVSEREFTMKEIAVAAEQGRVKEIFGSGTACVVCPVDKILYDEALVHIPTMENGARLAKRFYSELMDIQYGRVSHPWSEVVC